SAGARASAAASTPAGVVVGEKRKADTLHAKEASPQHSAAGSSPTAAAAAAAAVKRIRPTPAAPEGGVAAAAPAAEESFDDLEKELEEMGVELGAGDE